MVVFLVMKAEVIRRDAWQSREAQGLVLRTVARPHMRRRDNIEPGTLSLGAAFMGANMGGSQKRLFAFLCEHECSSMHINRWEAGVEFASTGDEKKQIRGRTEERQERAQPRS